MKIVVEVEKSDGAYAVGKAIDAATAIAKTLWRRVFIRSGIIEAPLEIGGGDSLDEEITQRMIDNERAPLAASLQPASPVIRVLGRHEVRVAESQPQYNPVSVLRSNTPQGFVLMRFSLDEMQRRMVAAGYDLFLELMTFGKPQQPVRLTLTDPDSIGYAVTINEAYKLETPGGSPAAQVWDAAFGLKAEEFARPFVRKEKETEPPADHRKVQESPEEFQFTFIEGGSKVPAPLGIKMPVRADIQIQCIHCKSLLYNQGLSNLYTHTVNRACENSEKTFRVAIPITVEVVTEKINNG